LVRSPVQPRLRWLRAPVTAFWRVPVQAKLLLPVLLLVLATTAALGKYELNSRQSRIQSAYSQQASARLAVVDSQLHGAPTDTAALRQLLGQLVSSSSYVQGIFVYRPSPVGSPTLLAGAGTQPGWYQQSQVDPVSGDQVVVALSAQLAQQVGGDDLLNLILIALTEVAALLLAFRFWTRFVVTRRIERLARIAADVASGTLNVRIKEAREGSPGDEITTLAVSVGRMVEAARVRSDRQAALDLLTEESAKGLGLAQIYHRAVSVLAEGAGGQFAAAYEMFAPSGMLILRSAIDDPGLKRQLALLSPRQYHSRVLASDEPLSAGLEESAGLGLAGLHANYAAVQIPGRHGAHGMLLVGTTSGAPFSPDRLEFLRSVAHMIAAAVNALHDPLTALPNRLLFEDRLGQALDEGRRAGHGVCLYYIDLDNFKEVNDGLGHQAGDLLLRHVADRLRKVLRSSDLLARLGGDEFALVQTISPVRSPDAQASAVPQTSEEAVAVQTATRLLKALAPPFTVEAAQLYVSASIGIAIHPDHGTTPALLSRNADRAMYEAKAEQKGAFRVFTQSMHSAAVRRLTIETGLRAALQSDGLRLAFQPQVDVARPDAIVGFEALLRWPDSGSPQIAPSTFVPVAEQTGLIVPMGEWALRHACLQAVDWQRRGLPPARMAVNVAAAQFARQDFVLSVKRALEETGLDPSLLELEVTEGSVMRDIDEVTQRLNELRELGVTIAVDDFGTGYSSLAYLNRLPFDALKVDRSFVRSIAAEQRGEDHVLVGAIVQLGRNLNKIVIAEGIETEEQLHHLRGLGCDVGQGFLFARPVSADAATRLLGGSGPLELLRAEGWGAGPA
jgi:diguanylate cyclase (GGDEF)-like protein